MSEPHIEQNEPEVTRVSDYYSLPYHQGELRFVDVDVFGDTRLFVDPRAIRISENPWSKECVSLLQDFFTRLLELIRNNDHEAAQRLLAGLREPNETHLGMSQGAARGRGVGGTLAGDLWRALKDSQATKSGLLQDLEDSALMIRGVDRDMISDITTNIIRGQLILFTQRMCEEYEIPMERGVNSGPVWEPRKGVWTSRLLDLPVTEHGKLLLVPKEIVRKETEYSKKEFVNNYVLTYLQGVELDAGSELVQTLKSGKQRVTKKDVREKYEISSKEELVAFLIENPNVLENYRNDKERDPRALMSHEALEDQAAIHEPDWASLMQKIVDIPAGQRHANEYHKSVKVLLDQLFYPELTSSILEAPIHSGRKRIDIKYVNETRATKIQSGFFGWLADNYAAAHIAVECKNYSSDPKNPELDQLAGRFSPSRGQVGILVCRSISDRSVMLERCKDAVHDQRGYILVWDDSDLQRLVDYRKNRDFTGMRSYLQTQFDSIIS